MLTKQPSQARGEIKVLSSELEAARESEAWGLAQASQREQELSAGEVPAERRDPGRPQELLGISQR